MKKKSRNLGGLSVTNGGGLTEILVSNIVLLGAGASQRRIHKALLYSFFSSFPNLLLPLNLEKVLNHRGDVGLDGHRAQKSAPG